MFLPQPRCPDDAFLQDEQYAARRRRAVSRWLSFNYNPLHGGWRTVIRHFAELIFHLKQNTSPGNIRVSLLW